MTLMTEDSFREEAHETEDSLVASTRRQYVCLDETAFQVWKRCHQQAAPP